MGQKFRRNRSISHGLEVIKGFVFSSLIKILMLKLISHFLMEVYQNLIICRYLYCASIQISGESFTRFLSYHPDKQNPVSCDFSDWLKCHGIKFIKIFTVLLNICAKFEEIPSTSKDAIGRQTCGAGGYGGACGPFRENSSHMHTSVPRGTLNEYMMKLVLIKTNKM